MSKETTNWFVYSRKFDMPKVEAVCPHGIGHDNGVHGCDGCCAHMPADIEKMLKEAEKQVQ